MSSTFDRAGVGSLAAADAAVTVVASEAGVAGFQLSGTFTATVTFEGTADGTNWASLPCVPVGGGAAVTTATAAGQWRGNCAGLVGVRARVSAYTSGTVVTYVRAGVAGATPAEPWGGSLPAGTNALGRVTADPPAGTLVSSAAYEASHVLKASAGKLVALLGYNSKATAQFVQVHDAASLPADAAVPVAVFTVPGLSNFALDVPITGLPCATGIVVCNSSTGPAKTLASADCFFTAVVI